MSESTYAPAATNVLFPAANDPHLKKRPMIFTMSKPLSKKRKILHEDIAAATSMDPRGEGVIRDWKRICQQIQNGSEFPELAVVLDLVALLEELMEHCQTCQLLRQE